MNKELYIKSINDDLEKLRRDSEAFFTADEVVILLHLVARYSRGDEGSSAINIANKLDLLMRDLKTFGEKNALNYIENFIKANWK